MIAPGCHARITLVAVSAIRITEHQPRYPDRVLHYVRLLSDPANAEQYPGFIHLMPLDDQGEQYTILDGHHRYLASVIVGRAWVLALVLTEPGQPGYDTPDLMPPVSIPAVPAVPQTALVGG